VSGLFSEILPLRRVPENIAAKCPKCKEIIFEYDLRRNLKVCPTCTYHFRLTAHERIELLVDPDSFVEMDADLIGVDPLCFVSQSQVYAEKMVQERKKAGINEAVITGYATIEGRPLILGVMDFQFIGGSMGSVVGEKLTRAIECAMECCIPLLTASASGGARMQEGLYSLMQMAKTSAALAALREARLPYFSLLTDPTTGGVTASFAMLGDVILAEPGGLICFAGPRVIEQFLHEKLPEGAVSAEFLLQHGMVDRIVQRRELRPILARLLRFYSEANPGQRTLWRPAAPDEKALSSAPGVVETLALQEYDLEFEHPLMELVEEIRVLSQNGEKQENLLRIQEATEELQTRVQEIYSHLNAWQTLQVARHRKRPRASDYIHLLFDDFLELHGDRTFGDDRAIIGGVATFHGQTVIVLGHQKGYGVKDQQFRNWGMPHPEGYRKASRLMQMAGKFKFPVICLIDTPGAFPGLADEERGQAEAIASNLALMARLPVPIIAVVIGEGGSGGALGIGVADRLLMLEHSVYTVAAPEAAASILWRDKTFAPQAATAMRISAREVFATQIIDGVVPEPVGGAHRDPVHAVCFLHTALKEHLWDLTQYSPETLIRMRYQKFRSIGCVGQGREQVRNAPATTLSSGVSEG
jgi:acyl-CoA carboxylase subunit beta